METAWTATWIGGPDAGGTVTLPAGRHYLGRSTACALRVDDPAVESHHAEVHLGTDVRLVELAALAHLSAATGQATIIEAGDSRLELAPAEHTPTSADADLTEGVVHRTKRATEPQLPPPIAVPRPLAPPIARTTGLIPALVGVGAAAVLAIVTGQPMFILFGGIGAGVAVASWVVQRSVERRADRRDAAQASLDNEQFEAALAAAHAAALRRHLHRTMTVARALAAVQQPTVELWQRRMSDADAATVGLGNGPLTVTAVLDGTASTGDLRASRIIDEQPVAIDLAHATLAVRGGDAARAVVRSLVVQSIAGCGPADVRVVVVTDHPELWTWLGAAPHAVSPGGPAVFRPDTVPTSVEAVFGAAFDGRLLVVCDQSEALTGRGQPLRRLLDANETSLIVLVPAERGVPQLIDAVLDVSTTMRGAWRATASDALPVPVRCAGITRRRAAAVCSALARFTDPDDRLAESTRLPSSVDLEPLMLDDGLEFTATSVAAGWLAGGDDPAPATPIGLTGRGPLRIDLATDGPHTLIAGTTGAGKSELLRSLVVGLAAACSPEHLSMVLIDYKGGATFDACAALPHVAGVITDLDERLASRALRSLRAELRHRETLFRHHHVADIGEYRTVDRAAPLTRLVVIVDEFAALAVDQPDFLHALVGIAQRGRSLGVHLVLATQRPAGVISDDIRANTNLRIALRLLDPSDALDVIGDTTPTGFRRDLPGRAAVSFGSGDLVVVQSARVDVGRAVTAIAEAATLVACRAVRPPWRPPLDERIADIHGGAIGIIDDPDGQRYEYLQWMPADGSVLVAASPGGGVSETLRRLTEAALGRVTSPTHATVLAATVDDRWAPFDRHRLVSAVIPIDDSERLRLAIRRLFDVVVERRERGGWADDEVRHVLVIDGFEAMWRALDPVHDADTVEQLTTIITAGSGSGLTAVIGTNRPAGIPPGILGACRHRWVGQLTDPADGTCVGRGATQRVPRIPGRLIVDGEGREAQIRCPPDEPGARLSEPPISVPLARRIERLPGRISLAELSEPRRVAARAGLVSRRDDARRPVDVILPIGRRVDGDEAWLTLRPGHHLVVLGPARSGRTTALLTIAEQWRTANPGGLVVDHDGLAALVATRGLDGGASPESASEAKDGEPAPPVLVVVDDAEHVEDSNGMLAAALDGRCPLTVIAAGHPERLRRAFGHWTTGLRASRHALIAVGGNDTDGDLVGAVLPRRSPLRARPGLMWMTDNGAIDLVQVACPEAISDSDDGP